MFTHTFNKRAGFCDKYYNALQRAKSSGFHPLIMLVREQMADGEKLAWLFNIGTPYRTYYRNIAFKKPNSNDNT